MNRREFLQLTTLTAAAAAMPNKLVRATKKFLGGIVQDAEAEKLVRNDLHTIWDDRVLKRAFQLEGSIPQLKLIEANPVVPIDLKRRLASMTTASV